MNIFTVIIIATIGVTLNKLFPNQGYWIGMITGITGVHLGNK